jgi:thiamine biosynthesis lipoprotein
VTATALAPTLRRVHVDHCMGTVFTFDVRDPAFGDDRMWESAIAEATRLLHRVDEVFSTYRPASDINRINRGELSGEAADPLVAEVLDRCVQMQRRTDGYFSPLWSGRLDPTGLVKGWAVERVSALLREQGSANHAVNGGGDVQLAGEAAPGRPWRIGIADPTAAGRTVATVTGRDFAVATSGTAERGLHIRDPFTGAYADDVASVTVVGRSLTEADCYATAAFARGRNGLEWLASVGGYAGLVVSLDGTTTATADLARWIA